MTRDEILEQMLSPNYDGDGRLPNDFISALSSGYPSYGLARLLRSENPHSRGAGAFIVANVSMWNVRNPLKPLLAELLDDPSVRLRMDVIEALTDCMTTRDGRLLGRVLIMLDSDEAGDRYAVTQFIRISSVPVLWAAVLNASALMPDSPFYTIETLFKSGRFTSRTGVARALKSKHRAIRRFAAAMVARPRLVINEPLLALAETSDDAEIRDMVSTSRKWPVCRAVLSSDL